jgi:hypothetical protein
MAIIEMGLRFEEDKAHVWKVTYSSLKIKFRIDLVSILERRTPRSQIVLWYPSRYLLVLVFGLVDLLCDFLPLFLPRRPRNLIDIA